MCCNCGCDREVWVSVFVEVVVAVVVGAEVVKVGFGVVAGEKVLECENEVDN